MEEHVNHYKYPVKGHSEFEFIFTDFKHRGNKPICSKLRNVLSSADVDAAIIIGGGTGTMHEFISSYDFGKKIGVLEGSGGDNGGSYWSFVASGWKGWQFDNL